MYTPTTAVLLCFSADNPNELSAPKVKNMHAKTVLLFATLSQIKYSLQEPLVVLPNGAILGREATTSENKKYYAFEKIPYASPPIGNLRFKVPQAAHNWNGTLNTTNLDVVCYQMIRHGSTESENCLYLNIYTPNTCRNGLLPVMVYIHGGGFMTGSAMGYPPDLFINNDVILVAINYRLGVFGFLSTGDEVIPGNVGLKDQLYALEWVQKTIELFGGDSRRVTIFGQSAGGGSCGYHILNKKSSGLFQGVILESGTFLSTGMFQRDPRTVAFGIATLLNSTIKDSQTLLEFFENLDAAQLNGATEQYIMSLGKPWNNIVKPGSVWAPVVEVQNPDAFLTRKMYGLLQAGNVLAVPTMMGFTSEESIAGNGDPEVLKNITRILDERLDLLVPDDMPISEANRTKMGTSIRDIYTKGEPFTDHLGAIIRYSSDNALNRAMIKHAELFSKVAKTYFYQFSYDGVLGNMSGRYDGAGTVGHTEELKYLFCAGSNCNDGSVPEQDLLTRRRLITLWTNFAKFQNPTPVPLELLQNVTWPQVSGTDFWYLDINRELEVRNHPKEESYRKWIGLYDGLGYNDFDTF